MNNRHNITGWISGAGLSMWQAVHGNDILSYVSALNWEASIRTGISAVALGFLSAFGQEAAKKIYKRLTGK